MAERARADRGQTHALSPIAGWLLPIALTVAAFFGNELIPQGIFPAPFFVASVMISAHFGNLNQALFAFFLAGAALDYFYVPPFHQLGIRRELLPSLAQFIVPSSLGVWFVQQRKEVEQLLRRESEVAKQLQGERSLEDLGKTLLSYLAPEVRASVASFYTVEPDGSAERRAGFAFDVANAPARIAASEGAIGQAIVDRTVRVLSVPPSYVTVSSSLGRAAPTHVVMVPAGDDQRVHAVMELGFTRPVSATTLRLLQRICEPIAIGVRVATYRLRLQELLFETQRQAEELQAHDEELRTANEELEERGRVMSQTQQKLESQQAELEQTNETLLDQSRLLVQQNEELSQAHETVRLRSDDAERATRAKSEFLANMSHELRTPLNSALILSKLLMEDRDGNLTSEQIRFAETIHAAGNDLLVMIDDILDLAKVEAGKLELALETFPLEHLRAELERTFEPIARQQGLELSLDFSQAPAGLNGDRLRLSQVLKNLLSNAFKFTERGRVSLTVTRAGSDCRFEVRDSGIGIAREQLAVIFEAFRQADGTTNRKYGGTGLGLSISRNLAGLMGGSIAVESTPGVGSAFTLTIPLAAVVHGAAPRAVPARSRDPELAPAPAARRRDAASRASSILIIEDDLPFAQIVADLARELSFEATIAATADEALALATERPPDGIVLDMKLPDHSGLSVLDRLKRDPRTRHVPVHVISVSDYTRAALEMGAIGYMLKPVEREQIKGALQKLEGQFNRSLRRLLVVEDDLVQRDAICQLLAASNLEIVAVSTVREGLEHLRSSAFDCVVTDLALPDGTGHDLLRTMANDEGYAFPSVVVYTGRSLSADEEHSLRQYSESIIVKGARSPERLLDEVTLFLHQVESTMPPERQRMLRRVRHREAIFEERSVLIVEDDVRNVFALCNVLEPKGMKVTVARNGLEALAALQKNPAIELVLMDIMMPEMDGIEATRAIRKQVKWAKLPIIALTAKAMKDDQQRCLDAGANDYIPKPLDVEMLLSLLRVWIPK